VVIILKQYIWQKKVDIAGIVEHKKFMEQKTKRLYRSLSENITRYFIKNTRVTAIAFIFVLVFGIISLLTLKMTGFPAPAVDIMIVRTIYPLANANVVEDKVTKPIEKSLKDVEGIDSVSSTSVDSASIVVVNLKTGIVRDTVKNKVRSAISGVSFVDGVQAPVYSDVDIGGPDYVYVARGKTPEDIYLTQEIIKKIFNAQAETNKIAIKGEIKKTLRITLNEKANEYGISSKQVNDLIAQRGTALPIATQYMLDGKTTNVVSATTSNTLESLKDIKIDISVGGSISLGDISTFTFIYLPDVVAYSSAKLTSNEPLTESLPILTIKTNTGTDQLSYINKVVKELEENKDIGVFTPSQKINEDKKYQAIEVFSVNDSNREQINEVIHGIIGAPLKNVPSAISWVGWIFGAFQLVFIVMLLFVSRRAAIVAAISIPLSLMTATISLLIAGETLNTLVLFSLVLVIGLVVDPSLVMLEALQRKIDAGLKGKNAAIAAVKDVGNGLLAATLTNAIVFVPLAVVSGILGAIFAYIPKTVIPALIGSYIVPLIFLLPIGSKILTRTVGAKHDEEENLWGFAKWLIKFNRSMLERSAWIRGIFIILIMGLSIGIMGLMFGTRAITSVQFSATTDGDFLVVSYQAGKNVTQKEKAESIAKIQKVIISDDKVRNVFDFGNAGDLINLQTRNEGRKEKASEIVKRIQQNIDTVESVVKAEVALQGTGGPTSDYEIVLSVKNSDNKVLESVSNKIVNIANKGCLNKKTGEITFVDECKDLKLVVKYDDGFKDNKVRTTTLLIDPAKLKQNGLIAPGAPVLGVVNSQLQQFLDVSSRAELPEIILDNQVVSLDIKKNAAAVDAVEDIKESRVFGLTGQVVKINDIATLNTEEVKNSLSRFNGTNLNIVQLKLPQDYNDQAISSKFQSAILEEVKKNESAILKNGMKLADIGPYSVGGTAGFAKSFTELIVALLLAIVLVYLILVLFFSSFTLPIVVLFTIPLTFIGAFPGLAYLAGGQFGFLEIIGVIILIGLVINSAIFLIDAANHQLVKGVSEKDAIAKASGLRLRPVLLTKFTAIASLAPLAIFSEFYRSLAVVIIFGLLSSGFVSLITTPIMYIALKWLSRKWHAASWIVKILFFPVSIIIILIWIVQDLIEGRSEQK
jgi:hydrophobic/amphiphilic exporter-1 (mainly G- bacteria), HAE1 family